ncbi:MAG: hypothetical protein K2I11_11930 [Bacteroides sp.]|nr:hypothetical protein [Bacteroides sp.]MDE5761613.1 hypothetical protein [Bacteroides sp.]
MRRKRNEEVALRHICNPLLSRETQEEDFDTLEFKVAYLTQKIVGTINSIWGASEPGKFEAIVVVSAADVKGVVPFELEQ